MFRYLLLAMLALIAAPAAAQTYQTGQQTPVWVGSPVIGNPSSDFNAEVYTATQGGDPPALAFEAPAIDENGKYVRSQWLENPGCSSDGCRPDHGEPKARFDCQVNHSSMADPILAHGNPIGPHMHDFCGNFSTDENSTYASLRNNPKSSVSGGPLNATGYWKPQLQYERQPGVWVPVKDEVITFYYGVANPSLTPYLTRILRGTAFIAGVDPMDRLSTIRNAEVAGNSAFYLGPRDRLNGWLGWTCSRRDGAAPQPVVQSNASDPTPLRETSYTRQLVNDDGSDPWGGTCEGENYIIAATLNAPECWDMKNLTSIGGRNHFRYPVQKAGTQDYICPTGWGRVAGFVVKDQFPAYTHAIRSKMRLSSDCMTNPCQPRGSTYHADWMGAWDDIVMKTWQARCLGEAINGVAGAWATCDTHVIDTNTMLKFGAPPNTTYANNPIVQSYNFTNAPSKVRFGKVLPGGSTVTGHVGHMH